MSRLAYGFAAAAVIGSALVSVPASAQCCNAAPVVQPVGCCAAAAPLPFFPPLGRGGCCNAAPVAAPTYYVQPQPQVVTVQPAPVVVQVAQPQVIVQQQYQAPVQTYQVNQGPVYSGPGADYGPAVYEPAEPVQSYPYVRSYRYQQRYAPVRPRPYVKSYRYPAYVSHAPRRVIYRKY
jgi:hypothetical protein